MNDEQRLIFLLHGQVRALLLERSLDDAYLVICKHVFPGTVLGKFSIAPGKIDHRYLMRVCDYIDALDDDEWSYASCYCASIVIQLISLAFGIDSEIVIGIQKQDRKVISHAWVETIGSSQKQIITPGKISIKAFKVVKRLHPATAIQSWMEKRASLDAAAEP